MKVYTIINCEPVCVGTADSISSAITLVSNHVKIDEIEINKGITITKELHNMYLIDILDLNKQYYYYE